MEQEGSKVFTIPIKVQSVQGLFAFKVANLMPVIIRNKSNKNGQMEKSTRSS